MWSLKRAAPRSLPIRQAKETTLGLSVVTRPEYPSLSPEGNRLITPDLWDGLEPLLRGSLKIFSFDLPPRGAGPRGPTMAFADHLNEVVGSRLQLYPEDLTWGAFDLATQIRGAGGLDGGDLCFAGRSGWLEGG